MNSNNDTRKGSRRRAKRAWAGIVVATLATTGAAIAVPAAAQASSPVQTNQVASNAADGIQPHDAAGCVQILENAGYEITGFLAGTCNTAYIASQLPGAPVELIVSSCVLALTSPQGDVEGFWASAACSAAVS